MIPMITTILVAGLVAMILLIAHEIFEHGEPRVEHRGADDRWADELRAMRLPLAHERRRRSRGR